MSTKPDKNLLSFTGDEERNIWLNEEILFWGRDYRGERREYYLDLNEVEVGAEIADTVKFSGVRDFTLHIRGNVIGGYEDCLDLNNLCQRVTVIADGLIPTGRYAITIKGGCEDILIDTTLLDHSKTVDVSLGEHSDQSFKVTREVTLSIAAVDGSKVTYWQFNADRPHLVGSTGPYDCKIRIPRRFRVVFARVYSWLKKFLPI